MKIEHGGHGARRDHARQPNQITEGIIGAAIKVHRALGPGLLESAYEACLGYQLARDGFQVERQKRLPIRYLDIVLEEGYRIDLLIDRSVLVELKSIQRLDDVHEAQLLSYVRLANAPVGLLINFNVLRLVDGVRRVVNGAYKLSPSPCPP